jgi:hypothetical protein
LIAADPAVDQGPVDQDSAPGRLRTDLLVRGGPCTQRGPSRVDHPGLVDGLALAPLVPALVRGPALAPLVPVPVVQPG